ncbi:MAG: hypothetical protein AUI48_04375 [Chloroflexi bacterium 13_1_40CM_2_68_14]|nr:MAG: hypothetical protein AUI48_04375 [Chloroflexi bacterium 13_1_40CM_2_68_14]
MTLKESLLTPRLAVFTLGGDTPLTSYGANCVVFAGYHFNYEEADLKGLPAALDALRSIQAERFVPGHGPSGGAELAQEQARYHRTVAQLISRCKLAHRGARCHSRAVPIVPARGCHRERAEFVLAFREPTLAAVS